MSGATVTPGGAQRPPYGLLANRPTAVAAGDKGIYFATDDNGGTLSQVQSGAWVKIAASATQLAAGTVLGQGEITSNPPGITSTYPTGTDITGLTLTTPSLSGSQAIKLIFDCAALQNNSTGGVVVQIMEGATELAVATSTVGANIAVPVHREFPLAGAKVPSAGAHTYKISISRLSAAGTVTLSAEAFIQAIAQ